MGHFGGNPNENSLCRNAAICWNPAVSGPIVVRDRCVINVRLHLGSKPAANIIEDSRGGENNHKSLLTSIWTPTGGELTDMNSQRILPGIRCQSSQRSEEHTSELQSLRHLVCRL